MIAAFGKFYLRNGEWWFNQYAPNAADNGYIPTTTLKYLCLGPANSCVVLDKTVVNYGGDSETDNMVAH